MSTATDAPVYRLGITQLLAWFFASGDLRGWQTDAAVSAIEGQASHRRIQKRWPTSVQKEAKVAISWCSALCTLRIEGRIDGVEEGNGGLRVIEIKTVRRSPHSLPDAVRERHWLQARLYAALWLAQNPACEALVISLELLYVDLREGTEHHLLDSIERAVLQAFLDHTRDTLLSWFDALTLHRQERNTRLRQLRFPFSAYREGQREMAVSLYRTIREGRMALVEAPTGSGKSLATLFPALKAMGEGLVRQVFFASTRNTGQLSALQALERGEALCAPIRKRSWTAPHLMAKAYLAETALHDPEARKALGAFLTGTPQEYAAECIAQYRELHVPHKARALEERFF